MSEEKSEGPELKTLSLQLGTVQVGVIDGSQKARTMPEDELRMMYFNGKFYRQLKHYKGMLCIGVSWEECDQDGVRIVD